MGNLFLYFYENEYCFPKELTKKTTFYKDKYCVDHLVLNNNSTSIQLAFKIFCWTFPLLPFDFLSFACKMQNAKHKKKGRKKRHNRQSDDASFSRSINLFRFLFRFLFRLGLIWVLFQNKGKMHLINTHTKDLVVLLWTILWTDFGMLPWIYFQSGLLQIWSEILCVFECCLHKI